MITKPSLNDLKKPCGEYGVTSPEYRDGTTIISTMSASMSGAEKSPTDTGPNNSAKWKNGMQDVPPEGRNQFS